MTILTLKTELTMETLRYYHLCADGNDAKNFIASEEDFVAATNIVGVCAANNDAAVVSFSIEDSHPHFLLFGCYAECLSFKTMFESTYLRHIVQSRGCGDDIILDMEIIEVKDESYLLNVGTYTIVQATKDGKKIMPFDYPWGSGSLYFRYAPYVEPWLFDKSGKICEPVRIGDMPEYAKASLLHSRKSVPDDWLVCNGVLLPSNYVDVSRFESIYKTCNCYRVFLSSGKNRDEAILQKMAEVRGVSVEDLEARRIAKETCAEIFGFKDVRRLSSTQRVSLAREIRKRHRISFRQLATIVRLPEDEIRKYIK